ncbi:hypothetical protein LINPERPRIM_LOCUS29816 [Linum perenne]
MLRSTISPSFTSTRSSRSPPDTELMKSSAATGFGFLRSRQYD